MSHYIQNVFTDDSFHLKSFVNKYVKVITIHDESREGTVFTIDPITESIVLVGKKNGKLYLEVIMRHIVKSVEVIDPADDSSHVVLKNLFTPSHMEYTEEHACERKTSVMDWLDKHRVPFVENGEVLRIHDSLEILPPYGIEQCVCNNTVILSRVKSLLASMPSN